MDDPSACPYLYTDGLSELPFFAQARPRRMIRLPVKYKSGHSICCRSENCISLAISGQRTVDSIDSFDLSNGKVNYRFDKCGRPSGNCILLVTMATRCKIVVESTDSFDWWEWLFYSRFHINSLSNRRIHVNDD